MRFWVPMRERHHDFRSAGSCVVGSDVMLRTLSRFFNEQGLLRMVSAFAELRAAVIGRNAHAILTQTRNGTLLVPSRDLWLGRKLCFDGSYCWDMLEFL